MSAFTAPAAKTISLADCRRAVQHKLAVVRRRLRTQLLLEGLTWGIAAAVLLTALSLIIDLVLRPDLSVRVTLLVLGGLAIAYVALSRLRDPIFLKLDDLDLAELLERREKGIGQRLTTVLQLPYLLEQDPSASPSMIQAAVQEDFSALQQIDLQASFNHDRRRQFVMLITVLVALVSVFAVTNPAIAALWARRWFAGANVRWPQQTYLALTGLGDDAALRVPSGESFMIQVESAADFVQSEGAWKLTGRGEPLIVEGTSKPTSVPPENVAIKIMMTDGSQRIGNFSKFATGQYRYELPPISKEADISITGGDDWFGPIRVVPIDRPSIESVKILAYMPGKSEPDTIQADDAQQQLLFLPTTRLEIVLTCSKSLSLAKAAVSGSTEAAKDLEKIDERTYRMPWEIEEPVTFEFQLTGQAGGLNSKPYFLTLGLLSDRPPRLTLRSSGVGKRVTPVAQIPLNLRVMDDFGVAKMALELEDIRIVEQKATTTNHLPLEESFGESGQKLLTDIEREPTVTLSQYELIPGATIRIRGTASDACVLGTQSGDSRWLTFQVVSAEELFYEILTRQRDQRAKLAKSIETAKGQLDLLRRLNAPSEAGTIVRVHQALARQIWQIAGQLNGTLQEMTLNDLGAPTARQLLEMAIIKPLYDLHANSFAELRTKLEVLTTGTEIDEERREAANVAQAKAVEQMQRILDKMSEWESFVDVVNQLRAIKETQVKIHDTTDKTQKEQLKEVFDDDEEK